MEIIEAAAYEGKAGRRQINHGWRKVEFRAQPRLHGVPLGGGYVCDMACQGRARVGGDNLPRQAFVRRSVVELASGDPRHDGGRSNERDGPQPSPPPRIRAARRSAASWIYTDTNLLRKPIRSRVIRQAFFYQRSQRAQPVQRALTQCAAVKVPLDAGAHYRIELAIGITLDVGSCLRA